MAKKSIGTILGEMYLKFRSTLSETSTLKIEQDLRVARNIEDGIDWSVFLNYIANEFPAATDAEKKIQAEALEAVRDNTNPFYGLGKDFRDDFKEAAEIETIINVEEKDEVVGIDKSGEMTTDVEIQEEMDIEEGESAAYQELIKGPEEVLILDAELYDKHATIMMPGVPPEEIMAYIAANEKTLSPPEMAMLTAHAEGIVTRPQRYGDKIYLTPFVGHFQGVGLDNIIDNYASGPEIEAYQNFLENNNIVPQNYFAESKGEWSEKLRTSVKMVMNWIDRNRYAVEGTELYREIMNQTEHAPVYFTKLQEDNQEFSYYRNLFNYGLKEMAKDRVALDEAAEAEAAKKLAEEFIPPSDAVLDDMVEAWFEAKLNRKPTAAELDTWSTRFANSYSIAFAQQRAKNKELESYNFMTAQPQYAGLNEQEVAELQEQYPGKGFVDLSMFTTSTPEEIMSEQIEGQYGDMIEDVEDAEQVRKMQQDMLTYMFGG